MRRIGILAVLFTVFAVLPGPFAYERVAAQTPQPLPAPTNVRIENAINPLPTDLILIPRVVRWDAVPRSDASYRVEQRTLPPRDPSGPYEPAWSAVSTTGPSDAREYRFETAPWRGPYCFRVVAVYPGGEFRASEQACVPKERDGSPYDPPQPTIALLASLRGFVITWPSPFYHGEYSVQKAVKPSSAEDPQEGDWGYASMHINEVSPGQYEFGDLGTVVGQVYCYRVRPNLEDGRWSPPACMGQPPVDFGPGYEPTPVSPDAGNGLPDGLVHVSFPWELTVGGIVLVVVAVVNWLVFRGYR